MSEDRAGREEIGSDLRARIAQAVQRASGNEWLAADYVLDIIRAELVTAEGRSALLRTAANLCARSPLCVPYEYAEGSLPADPRPTTS